MSILLARLCNLAPSLLGLHFFSSVTYPFTFFGRRGGSLLLTTIILAYPALEILLHQINLIHERGLVFTNDG